MTAAMKRPTGGPFKISNLRGVPGSLRFQSSGAQVPTAKIRLRALCALAVNLLAFLAMPGGMAQAPPTRPLAREIFKELIEINTTHSSGNTTTAAEAMAARLKAAGFPAQDVQVLGPHPRKGNLVARLRGTGARKPLL